MGYGIEVKEGYMGAMAWEGENSHKVFGRTYQKLSVLSSKQTALKGSALVTETKA